MKKSLCSEFQGSEAFLIKIVKEVNLLLLPETANIPECVIFPSDYFNPRQVDPDLQAEYHAASGMYRCIVFDYEKWFYGNRFALSEHPAQDIPAIYRGWMMKPEQYALFYQALREQHICLMTSPEAYQKFHLFPLIYPEIQKDTARILVYPDGIPVNLAQVKKNFSKFLVKDYVKSAKGSGFPDFFDDSVTQEEFDRAMTVFYRDRAGLYTGGICIKEFLELKRYDNFKNEYRIFVVNHKIAGIYKNSHQPEQAQAFPVELLQDYQALDSPFYTIDCAELTDGTWKIIETGDGQVSGLPDGICPVDFFRTLGQCFQE